MNTSYSLDLYKTHDLNIAMRTSSGDLIEMDFANHQSASFSQTQNKNTKETLISFSSMQSFQYSIQSNGIDKQDQKEIEAFMKIAQPFIDDFLSELKNDAIKTPVTALAHDIASLFNPNKDRDENNENNVKTNIVKMFDDSLSKLKLTDPTKSLSKIEDIYKQTQKLLEKVLQEFMNFNKKLYA